MATPRSTQASAASRITDGFPAWNPQARLALVTTSSTARSVGPTISPSARSALRSITGTPPVSTTGRGPCRDGPPRLRSGAWHSGPDGAEHTPHDRLPSRRYRSRHAATACTYARTAPGRTGQGRQSPPRAGRGEREAEARFDRPQRTPRHGRRQRDRREDERPLGPRVVAFGHDEEFAEVDRTELQ